MNPYEFYQNLQHNFVHDYVEFARQRTDAPLEFHLGTAFSMLAAAAGNSVTFPVFGGRPAWPNLYILLIAPSGFFRKTTVIGMAEDILTQVDEDMVIRGEQSREALLDMLSQHPVAFLPISEFSSTLALWGRDYMGGMREVITDLYDPYPKYTRKLRKETQSITRPALNILAASTSDWLREKLTEGDLKGGFMGRFILIQGVHKEPDPGLPNGEHDLAPQQSLVGFLKGIYGQGKRNVRLKQIKRDFDTWLKDSEFRMTRDLDPDFAGFYSRVGNHCLKLLALDTIAEYGPADYYEPTSQNLSRAIALTEWCLAQTHEIARTQLTLSKLEQKIQKIITLVSRPSGATKSDLLTRLHVSTKHFAILIQTAIDRGDVKEERIPTSGRTTTRYVKAP